MDAMYICKNSLRRYWSNRDRHQVPEHGFPSIFAEVKERQRKFLAAKIQEEKAWKRRRLVHVCASARLNKKGEAAMWQKKIKLS